MIVKFYKMIMRGCLFINPKIYSQENIVEQPTMLSAKEAYPDLSSSFWTGCRLLNLDDQNNPEHPDYVPPATNSANHAKEFQSATNPIGQTIANLAKESLEGLNIIGTMVSDRLNGDPHP